MPEKNGVIFGPWVGEFGWELFAWQAHCRTISRSYDYCVAISRPENQILYSDFCDMFLPFDPPSEGVSDSHMNSAIKDFDLAQFAQACISPDILGSFDWSWIRPQKFGHPPYDHWRAPVPIEGVGDIIPHYRLLKGSYECNKVDIVVHARNREIRGIDNWNIRKWQKVVSALSENFSFASIGTTKSSVHVEGTLDCRGDSTEATVGMLNYARCIVGPSSGPMHLATLSGCPQVWWTSNPNQNFSRYKHTWNPFGIENSMLQGSDPSVESVVNEILNMCGDK